MCAENLEVRRLAESVKDSASVGLKHSPERLKVSHSLFTTMKPHVFIRFRPRSACLPVEAALEGSVALARGLSASVSPNGSRVTSGPARIEWCAVYNGALYIILGRGIACFSRDAALRGDHSFRDWCPLHPHEKTEKSIHGRRSPWQRDTHIANHEETLKVFRPKTELEKERLSYVSSSQISPHAGSRGGGAKIRAWAKPQMQHKNTDSVCKTRLETTWSV